MENVPFYNFEASHKRKNLETRLCFQPFKLAAGGKTLKKQLAPRHPANLLITRNRKRLSLFVRMKKILNLH